LAASIVSAWALSPPAACTTAAERWCIVLSLYVVLVNALFWRRLYRLADSRFTL
jgi:ABC-type anion transport system duplicated permease subunit